MKGIFLGLLSVTCLYATNLSAAGVDVLVVGSTKAYGAQAGARTPNEATIANMVRKSLMTDLRVRGKINVEFEEVFRTRKIDTAYGGGGKLVPFIYKCHSLAQWYFWPNDREERLNSLVGKGKTKWQYVVLIGDPYLIANMPGIYAEGVKLIADKVAEGKAKTVLLFPWKTGRDTTPLLEVVCRVGEGANLPVLPRAVASKGKKLCAGVYDTDNAFAMSYVDKRIVTFNHTGTSSERGIQAALKGVAQRCRVDLRKTSPKKGEPKIDFNYGRANSNFEKNKQYKVDPKSFNRSYGFPMQDHSKSAAETMLYGIDNRGEDGTDLGIAYDMIRQKEIQHNVRCIPIRLMWAKLHDADPEMKPLRDRWHMSRYLDTATATFIYTLLSGRCPMENKPAPGDDNALRNWYGQRIGYETAWRMSHLNARVPGFQVRPKDKNATMTASGSSVLEVKFHYAPTSDVTVTIAVDKAAAATLKAKTLTFTPKNYQTVQTVTVTGKTVAEDTPVSVTLVTKSKDSVFDGLKDGWSYTVTKPVEKK